MRRWVFNSFSNVIQEEICILIRCVLEGIDDIQSDLHILKGDLHYSGLKDKFMHALAVARKGHPRMVGICFFGFGIGSVLRTMKSIGQ